ncbi:MAG: isopentenyl-diphosphate Delta-isomerase [Rubrobacter sp.]|nr:isopentenyl-diphosphate Delta-isomerase [Rubrobacter sp.]
MDNERNEEIILVDANDEQIGFETKLKAHENGGKLHRAFSVFIFDNTGKMLLQRRAKKKYHFGGLWTNACCSHPKRGEKLQDAAHARLGQEFGFNTELKEIFSFTYLAPDPNSELTEYEFDHVFYGEFNDEPQPDPAEIEDWKWVDLTLLLADLESNPHDYTPWFKLAVHKVIEKLSIYAPPRLCRPTNTATEAT